MTPRALLRKFHLYIAAFLFPFIFLMALSGGLELLGVEGKTNKKLLLSINANSLDFNSPTLKQDITALFRKHGIDANIDHLKRRKNAVYTRPRYYRYYSIKVRQNRIKIYQYTPDLIKRFMTLHKGNGPTLYIIYQKIMVFGLLLILLAGLWLGLGSALTRNNTIIVFVAGFVFFILAVL